MNRTRRALQRRRILSLIRRAGRRGMTRQEIEDALHMSGDSVRPRVWELRVNDGYPTSLRLARVCRPSRAGLPCEVLVANPPRPRRKRSR